MDETRINKMAGFMCFMEIACMKAGFSYKEGKAMYQSLAEIMERIDKSKACNTDEGVLFLKKRLLINLGMDSEG